MLGLIINTNRLTVAIPPKYRSRGSQATQLYLALQLMSFQSVRSPKAHWKTSMSCQGSQLGIPSAFPFVFVNCRMHYPRTRDSWPSHLQNSETLFWQYEPMPLLLLVRTLPGTHPLPWSMRQNWPIMHPISTTSTEPCVTNWILLQQAQAWFRHWMGNTHCPFNPLNALCNDNQR